MTTSFNFYADAALTTPLTSDQSSHDTGGSTDPINDTYFLGSTATATKLEDATNPGVDHLSLEIRSLWSLWAASTVYAANDYARTTSQNGYLYKVQSISGGGTSGAIEPTWPTTIGQTVVDNEVTWVCERKMHEVTEVKTALSAAGLLTATAGAALDIGTTVLSGSASALAIYVARDDATQSVGLYTDLEIGVFNGVEYPA